MTDVVSAPLAQPRADERPSIYALTPAEDAVLRAIANTLRTLAQQGYHAGLCADRLGDDGAADRDRDELYELADRVQAGRLADWWCCPICEEQVCDAGCPLETIRRAFAATAS